LLIDSTSINLVRTIRIDGFFIKFARQVSDPKWGTPPPTSKNRTRSNNIAATKQSRLIGAEFRELRAIIGGQTKRCLGRLAWPTQANGEGEPWLGLLNLISQKD